MTETHSIQAKPPYGMIAILFIGAFVAILNETLLNVALPSIMKEFQVGPTEVQWLTTSYMLINGILIPASAFLIQRFTNRTLFISAMALFTIGTVLASFSPTFSVLVAARMIQASGSAVMMPLLMNIMLVSFPIEKRGTAMGFFGLVMVVAPALGPTLSGYIVEHYSWRTLFDIVIPFGILTLLYSVFRLKNLTPQREIKLDVLSIILSSAGFGGLLYGFSIAGDKGWGDPFVYGTIIIGAISLTWMIFRQFKLEEPILEFRIFKYPMFALSQTIAIVLAIALFSAMILLPIYVQNIRGFTPIEAGLLMLPGALVMGLMSPITGRLFDKYGPKKLAVTGLSITIITSFMFSRLDMEIAFSSLVILFAIRALGMSMVFMPIMTNGLNELPAKFYPHGTAMNNTMQQVAGAIGSALLISIMNARAESKAIELSEEAMASSTGLSEDELAMLQMQIENEATLNGINFAFFTSTFIIMLALILTIFMRRITAEDAKKSEANNPSEEPQFDSSTKS
ncbi:EmrB/QacA subfamily drug resistance transporter [Gracilibacillus halotolerans]|uniref:EmrB/QacA subfamily drug resistance transporter n=1 Tax=Gracilibacillus halotolerans TaxID=74386 RepID=A0A841RLW2_9BACI|nr:MDR family MFS transporter [Gracilibacillus halotolerans]MBB6513761.1 EmrB/QacA subfamily drug resistance transporter [Gracilibacillus halotolerans]